jgi:hypothetical protein
MLKILVAMELEIWVDGIMEIMHVFFFSSFFLKKNGCNGNK